jgi:hypothetical protein
MVIGHQRDPPGNGRRILTVDFSSATPSFGEAAASLARNGFAPLPLRSRTKIPAIDDWPNYVLEREDIRRFHNAGVGILCGEVIGLDIDVRDEQLSIEIEQLAIAKLGVAPRRIGQPPKRLLVYRIEGEPVGKLTSAGYRVPDDGPEDKPHRVEILGQGHQFVAFGIHPDTERPYAWNGAGSPLTVPALRLPAVTREHLEGFLRASEHVLGRRGERVGKFAQMELQARDDKSDSELRARDPAMLRDALEHIPNDDVDYDSWVRTLYAVKGALGEDGFADFRRWSTKSRKNVPETTAGTWKSAKPTRIGAGTIFWLAEQYGRKALPATRRGRPSAATQLVQIVRANARELCHDADGVAYIRYGEPHVETWPLDSRSAREWMARMYYRTHNSVPRTQAIADAVATLSGVARYDGTEREVHLRTAYVDGQVVHDLCDEQWRTVTIGPKGWELGQASLMFRRPSSARPIAEPERGGTISDLIGLLDLPERDARHLVVWVLASILGNSAVPVLELSGPAGAGKTTLMCRIRSLIDPHEAEARAMPRSVEDLYVATRHSYIITADNVSHITAELSDALCLLCTGGGYGRRTLYTTDDETVLRARRPIIISCVTPIITAPDLLDRTISIALRMRSDADRDTETALQQKWTAALPKTMGAIYELVAEVLRERPRVRLSAPPRMADCAVIGETVSRICGWPSYADEYAAHKRELAARGVESSPVATALLCYMQSAASYRGPVGKLARQLRGHRTDTDTWPKSARGVADAIRRAAPGLSSAGLVIEWDPVRRRDGYHVSIQRGSD